MREAARDRWSAQPRTHLGHLKYYNGQIAETTFTQ